MSAKRRKRIENDPRQHEGAAAKQDGFPSWLYALLIAAAGLVAYWPATGGGYVLDDYDLLEVNGPLRADHYWQVMGSNRPVVMVSFLINRDLAGFDPYWFHLTNIAFHCLNALILWRFLIALFRVGRLPDRVREFRDAFIYGVPILFLLSPIQTESVAYISSRTELLATLFFLVGLWAFTVFREKRPWTSAIAVLLCLGFAVLSKQDKLTLPAIVLALDYLVLSNCDWRGLKKSWPLYGLLSAGIILATVEVILPILFADSAGFSLDWKTYLFTQFRMYFRYLGQLLWPFSLNLDPDIVPSNGLLEHGSVIALVALLAIAAAVVWKHRQAPLIAFGAVFFFVNLAPTTSFVPLLDFAAERRLYLPSIGFFLVVLGAASMLGAAHRKQVTAAVVCLALVYGVACRQRCVVWSDELLIWQDTVEKSPEKARPWTWLGRVYDARGMAEQAEQAWIRAEQTAEPDSHEHASILANLGLSEARKRNYRAAVDYYRRSLNARKGQPVVRAQLGTALMRIGRTEEAWEALDASANGSGATYEALVLRAQELYLAKRYAEAVQDYERASRLRPESEETRRNLAAAQQAARRAGQQP